MKERNYRKQIGRGENVYKPKSASSPGPMHDTRIMNKKTNPKQIILENGIGIQQMEGTAVDPTIKKEQASCV